MKNRQRPKKLKCKPGYEQRGAACQRITRLNRDEPTGQTPKKRWSKRKILAATVGAYVAASVATAAATSASWKANAQNREKNIQANAYDRINGEKAYPNLSKKLHEFEDSVKDNNFETLGIFDSEGNTILNKPGKQYSVPIGIVEAYKALSASKAGKGIILTHNHPPLGNCSASFSLADALCAGGLRVKQLRAVSGEEIFTMSPAKGGTFTPELAEKIKKAHQAREIEIVNKYTPMMLVGAEESEVNMRATHELWELVAKDVPEIKYEKYSRGNARYFKGYSK